MNRKSVTAAGALVCAAAFALPAGASAASFDTALREVQKHTTRADSALERAQALFESDRDGQAARAFALSRRELGMAKRDAARLRQRAESDRERAAAARAQARVADLQDENVEQLVGLLDEAKGRVESTIARAALADTRGRDKAIGVISAIIESGVSDKAIPGLTRALGALSGDRDDEIQQEAQALAGDDLSSRSERIVATTVGQAVNGQVTAASKLAELIASEEMPAQAKQGLQRAYDAVVGEQQRSVEILVEFSDRMPPSVRSFVEQVVSQARENAQGMRDNRPSPPTAGAPQGTPTGSPQGTPTGAPQGTPSGPPAA